MRDRLGGSGLATVQSYTVGGQTLSSGISVQGDTSITVRMPEGAVLGATTISVIIDITSRAERDAALGSRGVQGNWTCFRAKKLLNVILTQRVIL